MPPPGPSASTAGDDFSLATLAAAASNPDLAAAPQESGFLASAARAATFWRRAATVYGGYKLAQARAGAARAAGVGEDRIKADWEATHTWAGAEMRDIALGLGGFYLKVGQLLSNRVDFVAPPVCRALAVLFDAVPPMSGEAVRRVIEAELGGAVDTFFEGLDLDKPIGSASIAQVREMWRARVGRAGRCLESERERASERGRPNALSTSTPHHHPIQVHRATLRANGAPVAVKVARPGALVMLEDLANIRIAAAFLERTELAFDLTAAVDELATQIRKEFDFRLEAAAQDAVGDSLRAEMGPARISVPRTIPGLVTPRVLVMEFVEGVPLHRVAGTAPGLPAAVRRAAAERTIRTLVDAYGIQLLGTGLFQADPHPGNVLIDVGAGGRVGLIDFGQCKQLDSGQQAAFARLLLALAAAGDAPLNEMAKVLSPDQVAEVVDALADLGIVTELTPLGERCGLTVEALRVGAAARMFDSRGRVQPFAPDSTIKRLRTVTFPASLFFVLRTVQMLRGLATAAGVEVSVASLWAPRAARVLGRPLPAGSGSGVLTPPRAWVGGPVPGGLAPADRGWADGLLRAGRAGGPVAPAWAARAWVAAHAASAAGVLAAARALGTPAAAAPLLALYTATLALQVSWPAMLLTARRPGYGLAHGLAAAAAGAATAAAAAGVSAAAGLACLPLVVGLGAGVVVSGALLRAACARAAAPWADAEEQEGGSAGAVAASAAPPPPPAAMPAGVAAAMRAPQPQVRRPPAPRPPRLGTPVVMRGPAWRGGRAHGPVGRAGLGRLAVL